MHRMIIPYVEYQIRLTFGLHIEIMIKWQAHQTYSLRRFNECNTPPPPTLPQENVMMPTKKDDTIAVP